MLVVLSLSDALSTSQFASLVSLTRGSIAGFQLALSLLAVTFFFAPLVMAGATRRAVVRASLLTVAVIAVANTAVFTALLALDPRVLDDAGTAGFALLGGLACFLGGGVSGLLLGASLSRWGKSRNSWLAVPLGFVPLLSGLLATPEYAGEAWPIVACVSLVISLTGMLAYNTILTNSPIPKKK